MVTYHLGDESLPTPGVSIDRIPDLHLQRDVRVGPTYSKFLLDPLLVAKLCQVIVRERVDVLHAHNYEGALAAYAARGLTGRPVVYNAVNTMADELPSYGFFRPKWMAEKVAAWLDRVVPQRADCAIAISEELRAFLLHQGLPESRIATIPLGINADVFTGHDPGPVRARYGLGSDPVVI